MSFSDSIFWKIQVPNEKLPSFLLGTMHIDSFFTQEVYTSVLSYMDECKCFYSEVDINELASIDDGSQYLVKPDENLKMVLGEKKYIKLKNKLFKFYGFDIDRVVQFKSLLIINMLAEIVIKKQSNKSLDSALSDYAIQSNMKIGGVETVDSQLDLFDSFKESVYRKQLLDIARNPSQFRKSSLKLNSQYSKQEIQKLYISSKKSLGKLKTPLLYDRNIKMSHSIIEKAHLGPSFFAIGAAHLAGQYGVLRLLKHNGFKLTPVPLF